jgi:hypothetical protein
MTRRDDLLRLEHGLNRLGVLVEFGTDLESLTKDEACAKLKHRMTEIGVWDPARDDAFLLTYLSGVVDENALIEHFRHR